MSKRIRSNIWNRFEDVGNNKARCKLCRQDIGYRGGSTSSASTPATLSSNTAPTAGQACSIHGQAFDSTTEGPRVTAADKLLSSLQSSFNRQRRPLDDVILYMQEPIPNVNTNPLQWWQLNGSRYPRLRNLALKYLGIPATSTPSERVFSKAGEIVSRLRANLKPSTVDMLVFLSKNLSAVDQ
jgi:hypothetical protein